MASLTAKGQSTTLGLLLKGEIAAIAISGTYAATVALQREVGSLGSGQWETLKSWSTANATVAFNWTATRDVENLRLVTAAYTSGTVVATLTQSNDPELPSSIRNSLGQYPIRVTEYGIELGGAIRRQVDTKSPMGNGATYQITAAITLTRQVHAGRTGIFNIAAGVVATLPLALGTGDEYCFFVLTTVTSASDDVLCAGSDLVQGAMVISKTGGVSDSFAAGAASVKYQMNGTTKGGIKGSFLKVRDVSTAVWEISGMQVGSGTLATGFA